MINLDHMAIAVKDLESSISFYESLGIVFSKEREIVKDQEVKTAFAQIDKNASLELLEPLEEKGPIQKYIEKKGEGIHHIAFEVEDIKSLCIQLENEGKQLIYPEAVKGARNTLVNFIHPKSASGVLIELVEKKK